MDIKELKDVALELMDALKARGLGEVELEMDDVKIKIKSAPPAPVVPVAASPADHRLSGAGSEDITPNEAVRMPVNVAISRRIPVQEGVNTEWI